MPIHDIVRQRLQPLSAAVTSNRIFLYTIFSTFAVIGTVANACRSYSSFYSVAIFLSKSSRSVLVLANFGFLLALICGRIVQRLFFGPLQAREVERLYDQTWIFVTESLLAFTIFRDDFDIPFVLMFGFLLFVKCFHWLMADRIETMDQTTYPGPPLLFHIRMNILFCLLWLIDIVMFALAVESTMSNGVGGMVLFASEYAILMASALNSMARYVLSVIDVRRARTRGGENAPPMENKSMYVFYIELVTDFLKLATYLTFFMLILTFYGLPLNIIRDVYLTARSFITRLRALIRYHNATKDMDRRYPNATEAELSELSDRTCIICREEMASRTLQHPNEEASAGTQAPDHNDGPNMTPKKLPCGHIFHFQCLRSWLERQQSCPTCRRTVLETDGANQPQPQGRPGAGRQAQQPGPPFQGPQQGQPVNGPAGWFGRLLGLQAQVPAIQGPFAPGQFPPVGAFAQQPQPNVGWAPGQPPPPYAYPVHYPANAQPPPHQLQQPPVFRGFYGPGGVWHPWGMDPQWFAQGRQQQAPTPTPTTQQQPPQQPSATPANTSNASGGLAHTQDPHLHSSPAPTGPSSANDNLLTPRDAAAQAALRRTGGSPSSTPSVVASSQENSAGSSAQQESAASSSNPSVNSGSQSSRGDMRPDVPSLIPLYDLGPAQIAHTPVFPPTGAYGAHRAPFTRATSQHTRSQQVPSLAGPSSQSHASSSPASVRHSRSQGAAASSRTPLSQLPATLTDEQLARLDRITRDAIDERLRVLEGVSGAVYRCIEELTRVRSVLPVTAVQGQGQGQGQERAAESTTENVYSPAAGPSSSGSGDPIRSSAGGQTPPVVVGCVNQAPVNSNIRQTSEEPSAETPTAQDADIVAPAPAEPVT